jgi:hypothetical protein
MNALRVSLSLRAKENQCRNISHTHTPYHTDFCSLPTLTTFGRDVVKKLPSSGRLFLSPLFDERCSYNAMIEYVTIWKLKG